MVDLLEVFTITWNEEKYIQEFINFYRNKIPNCKITLIDNESTDNTVKIALSNNCNIITYNTQNTLNDLRYLEIKNNCWKQSTCEWVAIVDADEYIDLTYTDLCNANWNINQCSGFEMISDTLSSDAFVHLTLGVPMPHYSKTCLFKREHIKEINYNLGAHTCTPIPHENKKLLYNTTPFRLFHTKWRNLEYVILKHKQYRNRMSTYNKKNRVAGHYYKTEQQIIKQYNIYTATAVKIR